MTPAMFDVVTPALPILPKACVNAIFAISKSSAALALDFLAWNKKMRGECPAHACGSRDSPKKCRQSNC
jgi:hypothetical protein